MRGEGKATLLECVRKLKHERQPLDWIFHFSLWSSSTALSEVRLAAEQVSHRSVKPANFESSITDKKLGGSNSWVGGLCSMTSPVSHLSFLCSVRTEYSIHLQECQPGRWVLQKGSNPCNCYPQHQVPAWQPQGNNQPALCMDDSRQEDHLYPRLLHSSIPLLSLLQQTLFLLNLRKWSCLTEVELPGFRKGFSE